MALMIRRSVRGGARRSQTFLSVVETFWQDARYAIRTLRRAPSFAVVAVTTLALGIGATTTIFSVVDTFFLQPLPFSHADRLVRVIENVPQAATGGAPAQRGIPMRTFP